MDPLATVPSATAALTGEVCLPSPGLAEAPLLDRQCTHFLLTLTLRQAGRFNLRRDCHGLLALTGRHLVWPLPVLARLRQFLHGRCRGNEHWRGHESLDDGAFLERHGTWRGPYEEGTLFFYMDEFVKDEPKAVLTLLAATRDALQHQLKRESTQLQKNIDALGGLLQLNAAERALLLYGTLARYQRDLRTLLVEFKVSSAQEAYAAIADVAGVEAREVAEALRAGSRLERTGMVENLISEHAITDLSDLMKVSDQLPPVLMRDYPRPDDLMAVFTRPAGGTALQVEDFDFVAEDVRLLVALLRTAAREAAAGVNVLLYGPPGTGKTELAKVCAQAAGLALYQVEYEDRDGHALSGRDRYRSLQLSQVFLKGSRQVALLFDEVEDVFPPISGDAAQLLARLESTEATPGRSLGGKAWVNHILESNPVPVIWITNRIDQIDPAFRRRFQYHLQLTTPPPRARQAVVARALDGAAVSPAFVQRLAERRQLTPAQIRTAARFATMVVDEVAPRTAAAEAPDPGSPAPTLLESLIERQLGHAERALGGTRSGERAPRTVPTRYDLSLLNIESRFETPRIVEALRRRGHGTLCFHGLPGAGKTALAEHIAQSLGRPLMVRQASDLASKFVGETEQNMARMFRSAEEDGAVLLLDEADSFLRSRRRAERHYEVTEVNEMLQGMERFAGIFICTTNLFEDLDEAALRRFTFKIRFRALRPDQRERMFVQEALGGDATRLSDEQRARLAALDLLTPGDVAAVVRQADILGEALEADEFLAQLEGEHRLKPEVRERRSMGFVSLIRG